MRKESMFRRIKRIGRWLRKDGFTPGITLILVAGILLAPNPPYSADNYRYLTSSVLQSLAAIFALTATVTILMFQVAHDHSPQSLLFYPRHKFFILLFAFAVLLGLDGLITALIPANDASFREIVLYQRIADIILGLNLIAVLQVIRHVGTVVNLFKPNEVLHEIVVQAGIADNNEQRFYVVQSLEELAVSMISKHRISAVRPIIEAYGEIAYEFTNHYPELNRGQMEMDHPVREIPRSFRRIVISLLRSDIDNLMFYISRSFAAIAFACAQCDEREFLRGQLGSIAILIIDDCIRRKKIEPAVNFIRFLPTPEDEPGANMLQTVLNSMLEVARDKAQPQLEQACAAAIQAIDKTRKI